LISPWRFWVSQAAPKPHGCRGSKWTLHADQLLLGFRANPRRASLNHLELARTFFGRNRRLDEGIGHTRTAQLCIAKAPCQVPCAGRAHVAIGARIGAGIRPQHPAFPFRRKLDIRLWNWTDGGMESCREALGAQKRGWINDNQARDGGISAFEATSALRGHCKGVASWLVRERGRGDFFPPG
jgi:hypothetical protein